MEEEEEGEILEEENNDTVANEEENNDTVANEEENNDTVANEEANNDTIANEEENNDTVANDNNALVLYNEARTPDRRSIVFRVQAVKSTGKRSVDECSNVRDTNSTKKPCLLEEDNDSPNNDEVEVILYLNEEKDDDDSEEYEEGSSDENYVVEYYEGDSDDYDDEDNDEDEDDNIEDGNFEKGSNEEGDCEMNYEDNNYDVNYEGDCEEIDEEQERNDNNLKTFDNDNDCKVLVEKEHSEKNAVRNPKDNTEEISDKKGNKRTGPVPNKQIRDNRKNTNYQFNYLVLVFRYLKVQDLARASRVCKEWHFNASHPLLWKTLLMKNSRVHDWPSFVRSISARHTKRIDMKGLIIPRKEELQLKMWSSFCSAIPSISKEYLTSVDMGRCTPDAFVAMAQAAPLLKSIVSTTIKGNKMDTAPLKSNCMLRELVIKPLNTSLRISDISFPASLQNLISLSLTGISNLGEIGMHLPTSLAYLELGDCTSFSKEAVASLSKLVKLKRLRLEKGQNADINAALVKVASTLPKLYILELINLDIRPGFEHALAKCTNLSSLLIAPTYFSKRATTSSVILSSLSNLQNNLDYFVWVVPVELLKVADLIIEEKENKLARRPGYVPPVDMGLLEHIPILKEGLYKNGGNEVKIVHFTRLYLLLKSVLPTTRIQVRRTPYRHTWSQVVFKRQIKKKLKID